VRWQSSISLSNEGGTPSESMSVSWSSKSAFWDQSTQILKSRRGISFPSKYLNCHLQTFLRKGEQFDTEANGDILEPGEPYHFDKSEHLPNEQQMVATCQSETTHDKMNSSDSHQSDIPGSDKGLSFMDKVRRAIAQTLGLSLVGVNLQIITAPSISSEGSTGPVIELEEYLAQCHVAIDDCWDGLYQGQYSNVERTLRVHVPTLRRLATTLSPYQEDAANLAVQAKSIQINLSAHNLDYATRKAHCIEAIRFARNSDNPSATIAATKALLGNNYTLCYRQP
jgi:hypothetical protein